MEGQRSEVGEVTEFGWYGPSETVAIEGQRSEVGEVTEFGRQCAVHIEHTHSSDGDSRDA